VAVDYHLISVWEDVTSLTALRWHSCLHHITHLQPLTFRLNNSDLGLAGAGSVDAALKQTVAPYTQLKQKHMNC